MAVFIDNPSFPAGLKVIAIDHDITVLNTIEEMCNRFHYQVTKCNTASDALNLLERKDCFDVMLIDAHMPNMDAYDFIQNVTLQLNIPVIMMAVDFTKKSIMKSIKCGACTYWTKPLVEEDVKIMWQHVVRNGLTENKEYEIVGSLVVQENRKRGREDANASKETNAKRTRLSWSPELHQQFLCAVNQLGLDKARPKMILKIMDVPGLSVGHVASHLQKYRIHLKRSADETKRGRKKSKWSDSFQAEWIDKVHNDDFQTESIDQNRNDNLQTELTDQDRNEDFLAEWIQCGTGSHLHNLMI